MTDINNSEIMKCHECESEVEEKIAKATKWIGILGFLFIISGTLMGLMQQSTTDDALTNLSQYEDSAIWSVPVNGENITVGELKSMVQFEYYSVFVINYFLAVMMFIMYKWSKTSPFSAFVTALSVYVGVIVITVLSNGIKASLPTRGQVSVG